MRFGRTAKYFNAVCQCSRIEITYLEYPSYLVFLNGWRLEKKPNLELSVVCDHVLFLRLLLPFSFLFCLPSHFFASSHPPSFPFIFFSFRLVFSLTGSQSMGDDSCEVWVGLFFFFYSFNLQSTSRPES